jgi:general secretion pathway protein G
MKKLTALGIAILIFLIGYFSFIHFYAASNTEAKIVAARMQISDLGVALDLFYQDCRRYPLKDEGLAALLKSPSDCVDPGKAYISVVPKDPWKRELIYESPDGVTYTLKSLGADGVAETLYDHQKID